LLMRECRVGNMSGVMGMERSDIRVFR